MLHRDSSKRAFIAVLIGATAVVCLGFVYYFLEDNTLIIFDTIKNGSPNAGASISFSWSQLIIPICAVSILFGVITLFVERLLFYRSKITKLQLSERQLDQIGENLPGVIVQFKVKNSVLHSVNYCSSKLETYFFVKAADIVKDFSKLHLFDEDRDSFHKKLFKASERFESFYFEGRILINESELKWFRLESNPERLEDGDVLYNGVMLDITAQKEAEEEVIFINQNAQSLGQQLFEVNQILQNKNVHLQQLNKLKSEFLGMAAHDLKNPLNGVAGMADILRMMVIDEESLPKDKREEYVDIIDDIQSSAGHMLEIITATLNTEALEHGSLILDQKQQDLNKIMEHVVHLNMHHAKEKHISIKYETVGTIMAVVDSSKMREVMDNLVNNAVKYSPYNSQVEVKLSLEANDHAMFSVRDQGPGLSSEDQKKLFGRFQKLSAKPTGGESSTGLGLSIVKTIVELHKGSIWCESELGKGATFIVDIPLHALTENDFDESESFVSLSENL